MVEVVVVELAVFEVVDVEEEVVLVDFVDVNVLVEVEIVVLDDVADDVTDVVGVLVDIDEAVVLVELTVVVFSALTASRAIFLVVILKCSTSSRNSFGLVSSVATSSLNFFNVSCKLFKSLTIFTLIGPGVVVTFGVVTVVVLFS